MKEHGTVEAAPDDADLRILRVLQNHPEESIQFIGKAAGMSHTPCWRRLKRMQGAGIIKGRFYGFDRRALSLTAVVFTMVKLSRHDEKSLSEFEAEVCKLDSVVECYSITGNYDYSLKIVAQDMDHFEAMLKRQLSNLPFVADVNSSVALREVKQTWKLPI